VCFNKLKRSPLVQRGHHLVRGLVGALCVLLSLAAPPRALGQHAVDEPDWWSPEPFGRNTYASFTGGDVPEVQGTFDSPLSRLPAVAGHASYDPRNRASEIVQRSDATAVRRYRAGFFQRFKFSGGLIDEAGSDSLGIANLDTSLTVALPLGSFENLLLITPGFEVNYLDGPTQVDTPPRLYNTGVDIMWRKQWNDRWGSMVAVRPALASDFQTSQDAIRITGRALVNWQWIPERLSLLFGVVYLDRNDLSLLPGIGLIWTPTPDWRVDVVYPRPKLARRLTFVPRRLEDWIYLGGTLGGGTWAVNRQASVSDQLTLRDYQLFFGWERILEGGSGLFAEAGYVFGRELEYEVVPAAFSLDDAVLLRAGVRY
jgi:hypothetical protein